MTTFVAVDDEGLALFTFAAEHPPLRHDVIGHAGRRYVVAGREWHVAEPARRSGQSVASIKKIVVRRLDGE